MSDIDRNTRSENSENAGIIEPGGVCGTVFDLEADTVSMSTGFNVTRRVIYLGAVKRRARAGGIGDAEAVLGKRMQDSAGIV